MTGEKCNECGREPPRHLVSCSQGRCVACRRAPATLGGLCGPCWWRRQRAINEKLERLGPEDDDPR
jgi:hypothetical protein